MAARKPTAGQDHAPQTGRFLPGNSGGPGPVTEAGKAQALANLAPPEEAALQHGVRGRAGILMPCARCPVTDCPQREEGAKCRIEAEYIAARRDQVRALPHIDPVDWPAVEQMVWVEVRLERAARYLSQAGECVATPAGLDWQPLAGRLPALHNTHQRLLVALGLTPAERRKLADKGDTDPMAAMVAVVRAIDQQAQQARAEVLDGEFTAKGGDGGNGGNGDT